MHWYQKTVQAVLEELSVKEKDGLSYNQAASRLATFGPNTLYSAKKETILDIFIRQFKSPLIYILIFAAALVSFLDQTVDAVVIIAVITINAAIGTIQEGKARNSLERLKSLTSYKALVRRDGQEILIHTDHVVPGDILILHEGDKVPADAKIITAESLKVDEATLTGEAYAVAKTSAPINRENLVIGDQKNMLFSGTSVVSGFTTAVVVATGTDSELGKISRSLLETSNIPLPLAQKINELTHQIAIVVAAIAALVLALGLLRGIVPREIVAGVIGLSVSIVPEGLPVAVTVVLAKGVWRMARAKAIVRQMAAVEAMGNADVLMVDKTGTITTGKMVIKNVLLGTEEFNITGDGYEPRGKITGGTKTGKASLKKLLALTYLALKADVVKHGNSWKPAGDPTEAAIAALARKLGFSKEMLAKTYKTTVAMPFDPQKRYIEAVFKRGKEKWYVFVGAPEFLEKDLKIDHELLEDYERLAKDGLRVIGIAVYGPKREVRFSWALLAIDEEIREEVRQSVEEAKRAGFKVIMMTGDYYQTAAAIAAKVGIFQTGDKVLTGQEVEKQTREELSGQIENVSVFARITPVHKLKIVEAYKSRGHIVAMTGDGVNDGPALQAANLGIGLGSGTQVAKDSSDIVLVDDNFSTITAAIAEGRSIYLTLKKVILYLASTSLGEVAIITGAIIIGLPLPLVAVQIIWLNFVTDGFFVLALAQDPPEENLITRNELRGDTLIDSLMAKRILLMGTTMLVACLPLFYFYLNRDLSYARSAALVVMSAIQWLNVLNVRSTVSVFKTPVTNNIYIAAAFAAVIFLQIVAIQTAVGNRLLHTVALEPQDWAVALVAASSIIIVEELRKLISRNW